MSWWHAHYDKKRDKLCIVAGILDITREGALKTQIMYKASLSYSMLTNYCTFMLDKRLLEITEENDREVYKATEKGIEVLRRFQEIQEMLQEGKEDCRINVKIPPPHRLKSVNSLVYISRPSEKR
jgi:predicted transcriptional regulator